MSEVYLHFNRYELETDLGSILGSIARMGYSIPRLIVFADGSGYIEDVENRTIVEFASLGELQNTPIPFPKKKEKPVVMPVQLPQKPKPGTPLAVVDYTFSEKGRRATIKFVLDVVYVNKTIQRDFLKGTEAFGSVYPVVIGQEYILTIDPRFDSKKVLCWFETLEVGLKGLWSLDNEKQQ